MKISRISKKKFGIAVALLASSHSSFHLNIPVSNEITTPTVDARWTIKIVLGRVLAEEEWQARRRQQWTDGNVSTILPLTPSISQRDVPSCLSGLTVARIPISRKPIWGYTNVYCVSLCMSMKVPTLSTRRVKSIKQILPVMQLWNKNLVSVIQVQPSSLVSMAQIPHLSRRIS